MSNVGSVACFYPSNLLSTDDTSAIRNMGPVYIPFSFVYHPSWTFVTRISGHASSSPSPATELYW